MLDELCNQRLSELGFSKDEKYQRRLKWEIEEITAKEKSSYFLDLYNRKIRYPKNQNNLLVCYLLGIVNDFDINKDPNSVFTGDLPDIDIDYIPEVRDYLKNVWAQKTFGQDFVCNIGNYTTFGIKSALIDMARVHGESREEVLAFTKNLDAKDDEGKPLSWDAAMRLYPDLKKYCDEHPDIAEATKKLINRNRGMGVHAGGLIVANIPIHDLVPLVKRKDNPQASAWPEGLHGQDLMPVGLVKFDLLVISNLSQIARCCELIKQRHNIDGICNLPGQSDWTDIDKWRNDSVALEMANQGDLKCIFQFDSEGIRAMAKAGGVDRFEDLVAYTAIFRPGCLLKKMHERYIERKQGREQYSLHPLLQPYLGDTYGVMVYQEQIMQILNVVGNIPLKDCELVRKAISKKKVEAFIKYKEKFILEGQKNLNCSEKEINELFDLILAFSEYGFNRSHAVAYTYLSGQLLYLKAHYKHEFYTSILSYETLSDKIKEYKMEAKIHSVEVLPLDINKSKETFTLQGNDIYYGFSNVKGIGEEPAKKIVAGQPYKNFEDFLNRFGTDASVLNPLIGLRVFKDADPITLWKFVDAYKDSHKKNEDRKKRFEASLKNYDEEFIELTGLTDKSLADFTGDSPFDHDSYRKLLDKDESVEVIKEVPCDEDDKGSYGRFEMEDVEIDGVAIQQEILKYYKKIKIVKTYNAWKELKKLWIKRTKTIEKYNKKTDDAMPTLETFVPDEHRIDKTFAKELQDIVACEEKYYGFAWIHELEKSPDYRGNMTFNELKNQVDGSVGPVEIKIIKVHEKTSKKGSKFYQVVAEDATGQQGKINVWQDDMERWHEEFLQGNLLRLRLQPPSGGFPTFLLEGNSVANMRYKKRYVEKHNDPRVFLMRSGRKTQECMTDEEALDFFSNCVMN